MLFGSAISASGELGVRAAVGLPLRAAGVVVPAREAPAVAEALLHLACERVPRPRDAQAQTVVLRLLVVAHPVVGALAVGELAVDGLALVDHAAGRAVLVVGHAVG